MNNFFPLFARVLSMELVEQQDQEVYREVSDRQIDNPRLEKILFRMLAIAQVIVSSLLWLAALGLLLASFNFVDHDSINALTTIAVLGFIAIWASLLIGGQWFWYRIGMQEAQQAHFFLLLWGIATLILLTAGP